MEKAKSMILPSLVLLLLIFVQASAQCEGTIAFRTEEGKFGIVAVKNDRVLASPEYFALPNCSEAIYARGDEFCCATSDAVALWCFDWTQGNVSNFKTWSFPAVPNKTLQWPPTKLSITTPTNAAVLGDVNVATYSEKAASFYQETTPNTYSSIYVYRRNETKIVTLNQYHGAGYGDTTFLPIGIDGFR